MTWHIRKLASPCSMKDSFRWEATRIKTQLNSNRACTQTIEMMTSFLFTVVFLELAAGILGQGSCPQAQCGYEEPVIRFPFRIKGLQPEHCGYPGFELSCSNNNRTLLHLSKSVKFNVKNIDFKSQTIELHHQPGCRISRQIRNLDLSSSRFQFADAVVDYSLFNCSPRHGYYSYSVSLGSPHSPYIPKNRLLYIDSDNFIPCLSSPTYEVYAIPSTADIRNLPLSLCTKIFYVSFLPYNTFHSDTLLLTWSEPMCKHCESKGKRCRLKDNSTNYESFETECFGKGSSMAKVITGATLGPLLITGVAVVVICICISHRLRKANQVMIEKFLQDYKALNPTRYSYNELKKITNHFEEKLGEGTYGTVFKGWISQEVTVAVKILNISNGNGEEFINEVGTLSRIHHVNVVRLVGYCADGFRRALVYELLPKGSLQNFITSPDNTNNFLGWGKLQRIALGIAKGIEYLHQGCDQRILHFDIKPHNILLDHNFTPKICDFGLAKLCSRAQSAVSITTAKGTMGYIAPEIFSRYFGNVSYKSDVYSFGMVLLEMIGGRKITEVTAENNSNVYYPTWIYNLLEERDDIRIYIEDEGDAKIAKKLAIVGLWCIQWYPLDRLSMTVAVQMLEGEGHNLTIPPNPFVPGSSTREDTGIPPGRFTQDLEVIQELE